MIPFGYAQQGSPDDPSDSASAGRGQNPHRCSLQPPTPDGAGGGTALRALTTPDTVGRCPTPRPRRREARGGWHTPPTPLARAWAAPVASRPSPAGRFAGLDPTSTASRRPTLYISLGRAQRVAPQAPRREGPCGQGGATRRRRVVPACPWGRGNPRCALRATAGDRGRSPHGFSPARAGERRGL